MAAGGHGWLGRPAYADDPAMRSVMAHPAAGGAARLEPPMPSCQRADARCLSSHPRLRADGRTVAGGDRRRSALPQPRVTRRREEREEKGARPTNAPFSWPRGSAAGRTDAMRQAWRQEGMGGSGDPRAPTIPRHDRRPRTRPQASRHASSTPCPPASTLTRAGCPPIRASARTGGRSRRHRPPGRAAARLGGQTPCVKHGGRRACVARETCAR